jgi:hypothetical protein
MSKEIYIEATPDRDANDRADRPDDFFGLCPKCKEEPGMENLGRDHWCVCGKCKTRWHYGSNLFSTWRPDGHLPNDAPQEEIDKIWKEYEEVIWPELAKKLEGYEEVEPYFYHLDTKGNVSKDDEFSAFECNDELDF